MAVGFLEALQRGPLVCDGAMGTLLYERGVFLNRNFDELNLSQPELIRKIHSDYRDAGAQILETNTYGANRLKLGQYGFGDLVRRINLAGAKVAREVAGEGLYVAGSVGPTGVIPGMAPASELTAMRAAFEEQIGALAEGGVDVIIVETIRHPDELRAAIEAVRAVCKLPVMAQGAFDEDGLLADGSTPEQLAQRARDWGADVVGANCSEGPAVIFDVVQGLLKGELPVSAQPNAGHPRRIEGRAVYMSTPEYFGVYARRFLKAGVRIVGGCCGTTPEHVKRIASAARMMGSAQALREPHVDGSASAARVGVEPLPVREKSALGAKLGQKFVVSVEVASPAGTDVKKTLDAVRMLKEAGVDVVNIPDGPRAQVRMSNIAMAICVKQEVGMETIVHFCCRDRNLLGLQSDLLGCHALGLRNLVIITGDPPKMGDYPDATAVYDLDSVELLRLVRNLNRGIDPAGKPMDAPTGFVCAAGVEPAAADYQRELTRLKLKAEAGAEFIMTQPVFDPSVLERFLVDAKPLGLPILVGLLPLVSYRNAEFLHNEVPGMQIPEPYRERMRKAGTGADARAEGVRIAQEALVAVKDLVQGAYIMPMLGRYEMALEVLEAVR